MKVGTIILKVGSFVMMTEATLLFYLMPIQTLHLYVQCALLCGYVAVTMFQLERIPG